MGVEEWKTFVHKKTIQPENLQQKVAEWRHAGKRIATLNGSFDLMHAGHLFILHEASQVADILLVALNSDISIKAYKSPKRPIIPLVYRLEMVASLAFVDFVTWFDETDPRAFLEIVRPDVHVNGEEYGSDCIESEVVRRHGGRLHLVPRIDGLATSEVIAKILDLQEKTPSPDEKNHETHLLHSR